MAKVGEASTSSNRDLKPGYFCPLFTRHVTNRPRRRTQSSFNVDIESAPAYQCAGVLYFCYTDFKADTDSPPPDMLPNTLLLLLLAIFVIVAANCYSPRIIGGSNTTIDMFPYQVSIHDKGEFKCGGSVVSKNWVLTAAHCVSRSRAADLKIRAHSTYSDRDGTLIDNVKQIKIHQDYSPSTMEYDAALIELGSPIPYPAPVVLADTTTVVTTGSKAVVTGWGATSNPGPKSDVLQTLAMPIVDQAKCKDIFRSTHSVTNVMLCAGSLSGGKDVCRGDSGGPLVLNGAQIGIVSWGLECAKPGYPGVYTRVSAIRRWIKTLTMV